MIFLLKTWYFRWRNRDQTQRAMAEMYLILLRSARRCAYDLDHAAADVEGVSRERGQMYHDRSHMWKKLFAPDEIKLYRLEMHQTIENLQRENRLLREELAAAGIESKVRPTNDPF